MRVLFPPTVFAFSTTSNFKKYFILRYSYCCSKIIRRLKKLIINNEKLIVAVIALTSFKVLIFAQAVPAKQAVASKMHVEKSTTSRKKGKKL